MYASTPRYGSMDKYLDSIGIDAEVRRQIATTLTMPVSEIDAPESYVHAAA